MCPEQAFGLCMNPEVECMTCDYKRDFQSEIVILSLLLKVKIQISVSSVLWNRRNF